MQRYVSPPTLRSMIEAWPAREHTCYAGWLDIHQRIQGSIRHSVLQSSSLSSVYTRSEKKLVPETSTDARDRNGKIWLVGRVLKVSDTRNLHGIELCSIRCKFLAQVSSTSFLSECHPYEHELRLAHLSDELSRRRHAISRLSGFSKCNQ